MNCIGTVLKLGERRREGKERNFYESEGHVEENLSRYPQLETTVFSSGYTYGSNISVAPGTLVYVYAGRTSH